MTHSRYRSRTADLKSPLFAPRYEKVVVGEPRGGLTAFQRDFYEANGYLVMDGFFSKGSLTPVVEEAVKLFHSKPETAIMEPTGDVVRSVFAVHRSPVFDRLSRCARLLAIAREIVGDSVYLHQSRINYKAGFSSTGWKWHSDFETWHVEDGMPTMRCVSAMIALSDNTDINGPLMIVPGSHKRFLGCVGDTPDGNYLQHLKDQKTGVPDESSMLEFVRDAGGRIDPLPCCTGSVVLFDCNAIHGSNSNVSPFRRTNLFFVYNSVENRVVRPFCGKNPRPEHVATRETFQILEDLP